MKALSKKASILLHLNSNQHPFNLQLGNSPTVKSQIITGDPETVLSWMNGIDNYYQEISCRDYPFMNPQIEDASWGARLMTVIDPFGNKIMFNESTDK